MPVMNNIITNNLNPTYFFFYLFVFVLIKNVIVVIICMIMILYILLSAPYVNYLIDDEFI